LAALAIALAASAIGVDVIMFPAVDVVVLTRSPTPCTAVPTLENTPPIALPPELLYSHHATNTIPPNTAIPIINLRNISPPPPLFLKSDMITV
jgi:hypothetical protein